MEIVKPKVVWIISVIMIGLFSFQLLAQKKKVSCVGNSITAGYGLSNSSVQSYPAQLQGLLGSANWTVGNFGDSGRTMLKAGGYSYWNSGQYTSALNSNPDVVVIGLGTNDAKNWLWDSNGTQFKGDYKAMVQSFQNLSSKPDIYIFRIIPGNKTDWGIYNSYINKVNVKIKEVALEMGLGLIDLYSAFEGHWADCYQTDSVHPSTEGALEIAKNVKNTLLMSKPEISYANGKVVAPDGVDYQWYIDGVQVPAADGGLSKEMIVSKPATYKVSIRLSADSETRVVSKELSVQQVSAIYGNVCNGKLKIFPNPATEVLYVQNFGDLTDNSYRIFNLQGDEMFSGNLSGDDGRINISNLATGLYLLHVGGEQFKLVKKFYTYK